MSDAQRTVRVVGTQSDHTSSMFHTARMLVRAHAHACMKAHGTFLVRQSSNQKSFVVCVNDNGVAMHLEIKREGNEFSFAGSTHRDLAR
jgi:hypothetical protein